VSDSENWFRSTMLTIVMNAKVNCVISEILFFIEVEHFTFSVVFRFVMSLFFTFHILMTNVANKRT
jgi:hypothetical protein